jgi:hypothetical protein
MLTHADEMARRREDTPMCMSSYYYICVLRWLDEEKIVSRIECDPSEINTFKTVEYEDPPQQGLASGFK